MTVADLGQFEKLDPSRDNPNYGRQFRTLVRNVRSMYNSATPEQMETGRLWYPRAHDIAEQIGGGDVHRGAGVIAALSPGQDWDLNILQAHQFKGFHGADLEKLWQGDRSGLAGTPLNKQSTANIMKAHRIFNEGEDPASVLPMKVKTGNFYQNIVDPDDPNPVTIDTHAHDIAINRKMPWATDRGLSSVGRYNHFVDAYRQAANGTGATPGAVQAVTWSRWRDINGRKRGA